MSNELRPVTLDEQRALGVRKLETRSNYVPPARQTVLPPATTNQTTVLDVPLNAQQSVNVHTSEVDRSMGYLLRTIPLSMAFALVVTIAGISLAGRPFFSGSALLLFWISLVGAWMYGEYRHGKSSPNAVALEEVRRKWDNIDANDKRRWDAWEKATGIIAPKATSVVTDLWAQHPGVVLGWAAFTLVWVITMIIIMVVR
jgi:hypothetical protein